MSDEDLSPASVTPGVDAPSLPTGAPGFGDIDQASFDESVVRYSQAQLSRARYLLTRLYAMRRAARFYPLDHPSVTESMGQFLGVVGEYHAEGVDVHLAFFEGEVLLGEQLLTEESVLFDQLVRDMTSLGVGTLVVTRGTTLEEFARAAKILAADVDSVEAMGGFAAAVASLGLVHVFIGALKVLDRQGEHVAGSVEGAKASYGDAVSMLREVDRLMRVNRGVSTGKVKGVVRSLVDNVTSNRHAMLQLTGLKDYDEYTYYHSANVAILSLSLGSMVTRDYRFLSSLGTGALLHDIGKLSVDVDIINKPGALSADEWASMREHPVRGAQLVSRLPGVDKAALVMILEHHMRADASGYPTRALKRPQHLASRIVAVADAYDAMTSRRSYSAARVQDEAMSLLVKSAGASLDPVLVRLFVRMMGVYPARAAVRLSDGRLGVVVSPSLTDPVRPLVRVIADRAGARIEPVDVELTEARELSIVGCIDPRLLNIDVDLFV